MSDLRHDRRDENRESADFEIEAYKAFCADHTAVRLRLAREHDELQREAWGGGSDF
jgi:hypothetical protein